VESSPVNVIELRKAQNGWVICAWHAMPYNFQNSAAMVRGYETHVVESEAPEDVGAAVQRVLESVAVTADVVIPPARELP